MTRTRTRRIFNVSFLCVCVCISRARVGLHRTQKNVRNAIRNLLYYFYIVSRAVFTGWKIWKLTTPRPSDVILNAPRQLLMIVRRSTALSFGFFCFNFFIVCTIHSFQRYISISFCFFFSTFFSITTTTRTTTKS